MIVLRVYNNIFIKNRDTLIDNLSYKIPNIVNVHYKVIYI